MTAAWLAGAAATALWIGLRDARTARVLPAECLALGVQAAVPACLAADPAALAAHGAGLAAVLVALGAAALFFGAASLPRGDWIALGSFGWSAAWPAAAWVLLAGSALTAAYALWRRRRVLGRRGMRYFLLRTRVPFCPGFAAATAVALLCAAWPEVAP